MIARRRKVAIVAAAFFLVVLAVAMASPRTRFLTGGALVNLGYGLQDPIHPYDLVHGGDLSPDAIWEELLRQNELASDVREVLPRSTEHPLVALLVCMDARIDTNELVGDTRRYYYIVRTAGSALARPEQEMLELAVVNGVKVIVLTSHTDCAAEGAAADPVLHDQFPATVALVEQREERIAEFMARPIIRDAIEAGTLRVERARIDTTTDRLVLRPH